MIAGHLDDGTPFHAPVGVMLSEGDGDRVCCHLCGRWYLSVASHLRVHGWTKAAYIAAFGLEVGNPLAGRRTRQRRAEALRARQYRDPAVQRAQAAARVRARSGALTVAAAEAARGRPHPQERLVKTLAALSAIRPAARAEGNRQRSEQHLSEVSAKVAAQFGFASFAGYVRDRLASGRSLAAISREAGLHKDWLSRHLPAIAPDLAAQRTRIRAHPGDARLLPAARAAGHADVGAYLRHRHLRQHRTVAAIAAEAGVTRWSVLAAMERHGVAAVPHATKRHRAASRSSSAAAPLGFTSVAAYAAHRRAEGATWRALAAESGLPESTLQRHAAGRNA
ncbi:hypothetical protein AB0J72_11590 [Dactylosporangium sp. NPDC049742]|uniref:hypothetical protein n=1 Tax=Dactylosporangium sp. NPDC049742 TaxID=3154737 RepID=UPI0034374D34